VDYNLALDLEAIRFLLSLKSSNRVKLLQWLEQLKKIRPSLKGNSPSRIRLTVKSRSARPPFFWFIIGPITPRNAFKSLK